ncbi:MAG TPA: CBS domain-containing protein [Streptosporangiaceae bacterium]|nr:CBS domain-containing protein [Streptosporangiaceae bacterium]
MSRTDIHLDSMLRHLGAAYYESLHGRARHADVARALDTVEEHLHEQSTRQAQPGLARPAPHQAAGAAPGSRRLRWARRVSEVMSTSVITVDRPTPYKEIAQLLAAHRISGVPVLKMGREVVGVVTEADLVAVEDRASRLPRTGRRMLRRSDRHPALTAGQLMTSPAITIGPDATIPAAARMMNTHHVRRLPVVSADGKLAGIVSRRDLLSVFLRSDEDIAADARQVLSEILLAEPDSVTLTVKNGVVKLAGTIRAAAGEHTDLVPVAVRLIWDIDGVVDILDELNEPHHAESA